MVISGVIVCYNEAQKLENCLESLAGWIDEIIIVDMGSRDETLVLAKKFKAKVYKEKLVPYVELIRESSIKKASGEWILVIDPDERIPKSLSSKLKLLSEKENFEAINIPRKNIIFGSWIKHTNWWPDYQIRFFKKGKVTWPSQIHCYPQVSGKIMNLPKEEDSAIEHLNYQTVSDFLQRQNRYSEAEASNLFACGKRFSYFNLCWRPTRVFLQRYFRHLGFLDGFAGLALSFLSSYSQLALEVKLWEKTKKLSSS